MNWDLPRTEEGFQTAIGQLEEARSANDRIEIGNGLLCLAHLVKWVRSDTDADPFQRSHELAIEALDVFRNVDHKPGIVRAIIAAVPFSERGARNSLLAEADGIAKEIGDEKAIADVLAARARTTALADRAKADSLHREALAIYSRLKDVRGQANCNFALAIGESSTEEKRDFALEAARFNRDLGEFAEAARSMTLALMNAEEIQSIVELEEMALAGLKDAQNSDSRNLEGMFYPRLAQIADAKGNLEEAEKYRRWARDIEESDGLTPHERWQEEVEFGEMSLELARSQGSLEAVAMFEEHLRELRESEPKMT